MTDFCTIVNNFDGETSDFRKFLKALRDAIPKEDHPKKDFYTAREILSLYDPYYNCEEVEKYGDAKCKCGHNIKFLYSCIYRENRTIIVKPIGSECIKKFNLRIFGGAELKKILDTFPESRIFPEKAGIGFNIEAWKPIMGKDFRAENGFNKHTMGVLKRILEPHQFIILTDWRRSKLRTIPFCKVELEILYDIICRIKEVYDTTLDSYRPHK